jgi:hypothetical protein
VATCRHRARTGGDPDRREWVVCRCHPHVGIQLPLESGRRYRRRPQWHHERNRKGAGEVDALTEAGMREAVVAHLVQRPAATEGTNQTGRRRWSTSIRYGGGPGADPATIEFVKTRSFPTCQLHSVSYVNHRGWTMHDLIKTWQEPENAWRVHVLGGGAGPDPHRSRPWVNFCAGFGPQDFSGGGHVVEDGAERATSVRLRFTNEILIEDTVNNGVVLFFEPQAVVTPAEVSVVDGSGATLVSYLEFGDFAPSN